MVNDGAQILTFTGSGTGPEVYATGIYTITMFDQTELRITKEDTTTDSNGDAVVKMEELRFTR